MLYVYKCKTCGLTQEVQHKVDEPGPATCALCKEMGTMEKQIQPTTFILKGGGWGKNGYSN